MNKIWSIALVLTIFIFFGGCKQNSSTISADNLVGATYSGVIPCADCPGILYKISLNKNRTYESSSTYIAESLHPFTERGSWEMQHDSLLVLRNDHQKVRSFFIRDSTLTMLDGDQSIIKGPLADYFVLERKDLTFTSAKKWPKLQQQGFNFRASGNEPYWNLNIDFSKMMTFDLMDDDSVAGSVSKMQKDTASKARVLNADTVKGSLRIELYPTGCIDDMSGNLFTHGVAVKYGEKIYRGCGNFISKNYRLHDFWTLHSLKDSQIDNRDSLQKIPALSFNLPKRNISGNSGCNFLNGSFTLEEDRLTFGQLISTKMACPGAMQFETQFLDTLGKVSSYEINEGELILFSKADTLMIFRRSE